MGKSVGLDEVSVVYSGAFGEIRINDLSMRFHANALNDSMGWVLNKR